MALSIFILKEELAKYEFCNNLPIHLIEASEAILEDELPALAIRRKPDCSTSVAERQKNSKEVDALVGAGSSGAASVTAIKYIGMLDGLKRPAIISSLYRKRHKDCNQSRKN